MPQLKKMLVAFNPDMPNEHSSDFLVPHFDGTRIILRGIKSGKSWSYGVMVYVGRAVTENDLFAKLVDCGAIIDDVQRALQIISDFMANIEPFKIGNVVELSPRCGPNTVLVELAATTPSGFGRRANEKANDAESQ